MSTNLQRPSSYLTQIRDIALLPSEKVYCLFDAEVGILNEPTSSGRLLVATDQRIISFEEGQNEQETLLLPIEDLKGVSVKSSGPRHSLSLMQGLLLVVGGIVIYATVAYWLTKRFDGPMVPIINLDLAPIILLFALLTGGWIAWQQYFTSEGGSVKFQGSNWSFSLPYLEESPGEEVYQLVNLIFAARYGRSNHQ